MASLFGSLEIARVLVRFDHVANFIVNPDDTPVTIIEIRPSQNGWKCFEAPGVEPVFLNQEDAISYATGRACFRSGEIRILDSRGTVERILAFSETDRRL
jgi:hypothetical protein